MHADSPNPQVDWTQVERQAHELSRRHGRHAQVFAERLAAKAETVADPQALQFWQAVAASLAPRD